MRARGHHPLCHPPPPPCAGNGGDQLPALQWLATTAGQCTEAAYPYTSGGGTTGKCKTACTGVVKVTGGVEVEAKNETALLAAIASVPLSLSVDASSNGWQLYAGGVYTAACKCNKLSCLDHAVGGVGYGTDPKSGDYYIVRNSWSAGWGENGYIRLARGDKYGPEGQCVHTRHARGLARARRRRGVARPHTPPGPAHLPSLPRPQVRRAAGLAVGHRIQLGAHGARASRGKRGGAQHAATHNARARERGSRTTPNFQLCALPLCEGGGSAVGRPAPRE